MVQVTLVLIASFPEIMLGDDYYHALKRKQVSKQNTLWRPHCRIPAPLCCANDIHAFESDYHYADQSIKLPHIAKTMRMLCSTMSQPRWAC